jgi:hypothetical protein
MNRRPLASNLARLTMEPAQGRNYFFFFAAFRFFAGLFAFFAAFFLRAATDASWMVLYSCQRHIIRNGPGKNAIFFLCGFFGGSLDLVTPYVLLATSWTETRWKKMVSQSNSDV